LLDSLKTLKIKSNNKYFKGSLREIGSKTVHTKSEMIKKGN